MGWRDLGRFDSGPNDAHLRLDAGSTQSVSPKAGEAEASQPDGEQAVAVGKAWRRHERVLLERKECSYAQQARQGEVAAETSHALGPQFQVAAKQLAKETFLVKFALSPGGTQTA